MLDVWDVEWRFAANVLQTSYSITSVEIQIQTRGIAPGLLPPNQSRVRLIPQLPSQQRQHGLRHGVGLGQHRRTRLLQHLVPRQRGGFRRKISIDDTAA